MIFCITNRGNFGYYLSDVDKERKKVNMVFGRRSSNYVAERIITIECWERGNVISVWEFDDE